MRHHSHSVQHGQERTSSPSKLRQSQTKGPQGTALGLLGTQQQRKESRWTECQADRDGNLIVTVCRARCLCDSDEAPASARHFRERQCADRHCGAELDDGEDVQRAVLQAASFGSVSWKRRPTWSLLKPLDQGFEVRGPQQRGSRAEEWLAWRNEGGPETQPPRDAQAFQFISKITTTVIPLSPPPEVS